jgi:hypothetical protein
MAEEFKVGDLVTRDGTDIQRVIVVGDYNDITVECIRAPDSGWMKVGETELNLAGRYQRVDVVERKVTPEEIITELKEFIRDIDRFPKDDTFRCELDRGAAKAVLAAIRAAENDALERVAVHCDEEAAKADVRGDKSLDPVEGGYSSAYEEAAAFARSMKHK